MGRRARRAFAASAILVAMAFIAAPGPGLRAAAPGGGAEGADLDGPSVVLEAADLELVQGAAGVLTVALFDLGDEAISDVSLKVRLFEGPDGEPPSRHDVYFANGFGVMTVGAGSVLPGENATWSLDVSTDPDAPVGDYVVRFELEYSAGPENVTLTGEDGGLPDATITLTERTPLIPGYTAPAFAAAVLAALAVARSGRRRPRLR